MSDSMRSAEPVAVITGGARGIGRSIVDRFLAEGYRVLVVDVNEKAIAALRESAAGTDPRVEVAQISVSDRPAVQQRIDALVDRHGRVDALVNNAGMTLPATFLDQNDDDWERILDVNLTGTFVMSQVVARRMVEAGGGAIVNCGSVSAHGVRTGPPAYAAAKAGIEGLARLMAVQLSPRGVRVNTIVVGTTATPWLLGRKTEAELAAMAESTLTGHIGEPDDVAATAAFLCSDDAKQITGQMISVSGGQWVP
jgi:3-oxoacyl-[acyl-carrier protein] reductase